MEEKLKAADKGDLLDFRMDGGMSAQVFEGQDYSKGRHKVRACSGVLVRVISLCAWWGWFVEGGDLGFGFV